MKYTLAAIAFLLLARPVLAETDAQKQAEAQADAEERAKRAQQEKELNAKAPPPAIPGAVSNGEVAPATKNAAEMSPNDALFDAINRGDSAAARDALNRGAQLDARNVLGQTPIDASIDENRNDITFLLLSMRGALGGGSGRPVRQVAVSVPQRYSVGGHAHHVQQVAGGYTPAPVPADPGRPNASVGFNGF